LGAGTARDILLFPGSTTAHIPGVEPEDYPRFMQVALREAQLAYEKGEVPVGALVVFENRVIGRGHNLTESMHDATAHAEIIALSAAYSHFGDWRLENCILVSTLEPCAMCAGAAVLSRIQTIVYGARDPKFGGCESIFQIPAERKLNHRIELVGGVMEAEVAALMRQFFRERRDDKEKIN
jgi:tRNA(adenine34) deaminase